MKCVILNEDEICRLKLSGKICIRRPINPPCKCYAASNSIAHREPGDAWYGDHVWSMRTKSSMWGDYTNERFIEKFSPFGKVGTDLWVKEKWGWSGFASMDPSPTQADFLVFNNEDGMHKMFSPVSMPRWASRMTIKVKNIQVVFFEGCWQWHADVERISFKGKESDSASVNGLA